MHMRFQWLVCLLLGSLAAAQAAPPVPAPAAGRNAAQTAPEKTPEPEVGPNDVVLTVKGACANTTTQAADCKTEMTRAQFEQLANALRPNMTPSVRRQLANAYARMLLMSADAEKRGLEKRPDFQEKQRFMRMQLLSQELSTFLQEESNKVSDSDIEDYYKKNPSAFDDANLLRIFVPRTKQLANPKANSKPEEIEAQRKASEEAMKKVAADLHERAVKGEDFDKLQKEAYTAAGQQGPPPTTKQDNVRRISLPPSQSAVLDLKPGEVSELITDPGGMYIYKMVSKETLKLDAVKQEIRNTLSRQRYLDAMQVFQSKAPELNEAYFGNPKSQPKGEDRD